MSVGAILGAFGTMRAGRRVGRGVEAGSALLAQAAIQSGDLVGRHIASAIIQVADRADAIANGLTASFERTVAAALVNVHGDVRMTLDEMERISAGWKTLVESEMQKFRMTLLTSFGLLVLAIALLAPLVHNELAGNSAWISKTMHFVYECKFALRRNRLLLRASTDREPRLLHAPHAVRELPDKTAPRRRVCERERHVPTGPLVPLSRALLKIMLFRFMVTRSIAISTAHLPQETTEQTREPTAAFVRTRAPQKL